MRARDMVMGRFRALPGTMAQLGPKPYGASILKRDAAPRGAVPASGGTIFGLRTRARRSLRWLGAFCWGFVELLGHFFVESVFFTVSNAIAQSKHQQPPTRG
jgi:hypothetical protein